ncbi:MAG: Gfo/Idh/MocA family protein, partial [Halobacteriaceae archaeon]
HAEKPLGWPWGECRRMVQECARRGVQLTVGHQQRLSDTARQTREWVEAGAIGSLERVEISRVNLFDAAAHQLDLGNWFAGDRPAEWVLGNVDYRERNLHKGVHQEQGAVALWKYPGGVFGFITVGTGDALLPEQSIVLRGSEGTIERAHGSHARLRRFGEAPETVAATDRDDSKRAVEHAVDCLRSGERSPLDAEHALNAMELTYGIRESARRRGRVEFPLTVEDDPLEAMVESGALL